MVFGILVDGDAEFHSFGLLTSKIPTPHIIREPLRADIQPLAPLPQIAQAISRKAPILRAKGADVIVVLLDCERQGTCCGQMAVDLEREIARRDTTGCVVRVVVKNYRYENWLVADVEALAAQPQRFPLARHRAKGRVSCDRADAVDALALLRGCTPKNHGYDKVADAKRIMQLACPLKIGQNSRSFRRFLRLVGCSHYAAQSRLPQAPASPQR